MTRPKGKRPVSQQNAERAKSGRTRSASKRKAPARSVSPAAEPSGPATSSRPRTLREAVAGLRADPTAGGEGTISPTRKWLAIGAASVLATTAFWMIVFAVVAPELDNPPGSVVPWYVLGGLGVPMTFFVLAWISRVAQPVNVAAVATLLAAGITGVLLGLGFLLGGLLPLPAVAVFGFGAGGLKALRMDDPGYLRPRLWSVLLAGIYTMVMLIVAPSLGISLSTLFPFNALGIADLVVDRRRAKRGAA